jgi:hypothetical protein
VKLEHWLKRQRLTLKQFLRRHKFENYEELESFCKNKNLICFDKEEVDDVFADLQKHRVVEKRTNSIRQNTSKSTKNRSEDRRSNNSNSARRSKTKPDESKSVRRTSRKRKEDN